MADFAPLLLSRPFDTGSQLDPADKDISVPELWQDAAQAFEKICGKSLQRGELKTFDDVQKKIEAISKTTFEEEPKEVGEKAKNAGLKLLKYLKMFVGAASQAAEFTPLPGTLVNMTTSALSFILDIPAAIKGYNDAINDVFTEVSSVLAQVS
ncbi:putative neutral amino acid permease protein [Mycena kentingensis (nom. inval.)]|nr:putative neutral amino acid permease protein [Mycena kentingensis (nom. inval.)]